MSINCVVVQEPVMNFSDQLYGIQGEWIHKSPSDQCKVILWLAVSNNGVALDYMSLSFLLCKLM